ncbi:MAG: alkaline phosphatase family protein [Gemmatimonadales bacterium]
MLLSAFLMTAALTPAAHPAPKPRPRLVVFIAVDQFRPDYLSRYDRQFIGGLRRLLDRGVVFLNGEQDHAVTETAPGHSTMLSGRSPASTNIVTNALGVPDPATRILGLPDEAGASPIRFRGSELFDWLLAADSESRALSVSRKDRAAILPIGRARENVYWYLRGRWTTSDYYRDSLPGWVQAYDARPGARALAGRAWTLLLPDSAYAEPDSEPYERGGKDYLFPHNFPLDSAAAARGVIDFPWMDSLTLDIALEGVRQLKLGQGGHTDLLSISLSTTDAVGHAFGPDSREIHDQVLRVDHWLGWFLDSLTKLVPEDSVVFALTADHGSTSYPEALHARGLPGGRIGLKALVAHINATFNNRFAVDFGFAQEGGLIYGDVAALKARGINVDSLAANVAAQMRSMPGVETAYTGRGLAAAGDPDTAAGRWRRQLPLDFNWLVAGVAKPGYQWSDGVNSTSHGTTNIEDVRVPIAFWGMGIAPARPARIVRTVDIAPTLARLLGVRPTERLEGAPLFEVTGKGDPR